MVLLAFLEHNITARCSDTEDFVMKKEFQCVDELNLSFTASIVLNKGKVAAGV